MSGTIIGLSRSAAHAFSKDAARQLTLIEGVGIEGDAHAGVTVQHRSRVARDPSQPNLRQVHLLHDELLQELSARGFPIRPGMLGENVTTSGVDLLALPTGTQLHLGATAVIELTGLRNPCSQIESFHEGLLAAVVQRGADGRVTRKAGVMAIVVRGGVIATGDRIEVTLPAEPHRPLEVV
jgi:MOSC domain-containing protein YiiM